MGITRRKGGKGEIITNNLSALLKRAYLGGVLEECVLDISKGEGIIRAVDITSSLVVLGEADVTTEDVTATIGLGNIGLLIQFLSSMGEKEVLSVKVGEKHLVIKRKDGRRKLDYLLTAPDLIATRLTLDDDDDEDPEKKMKAMMTNRVRLLNEDVKDFMSSFGMLTNKSTTLEFDAEEDVCKFVCGGMEDHQFEIVLNDKVKGEGEDLKIRINGEHLARILRTMDGSDERDAAPVLHFGPDPAPIMIKDGATIWALQPMVEAVGEGE